VSVTQGEKSNPNAFETPSWQSCGRTTEGRAGAIAGCAQVGGNHYAAAIQPVDFIVANNIPFREGNIIKYVFRHASKGGLEDLLKARHYLDMLIAGYEGGKK